MKNERIMWLIFVAIVLVGVIAFGFSQKAKYEMQIQEAHWALIEAQKPSKIERIKTQIGEKTKSLEQTKKDLEALQAWERKTKLELICLEKNASLEIKGEPLEDCKNNIERFDTGLE